MQWSPTVRAIPGMLLVRPNEEIFFANATALRVKIVALAHASTPRPHAVLLDLEESGELDVPGVDMLRELYEQLQHDGITLLLVRVHHMVRAMLDRSGLTTQLGADHIYPRVLGAVRVNLLAAGDEGNAQLHALFTDAVEQLLDVAKQNAGYAGEAERKQLAEASQTLEKAIQAVAESSADRR